MSLVKLEIRIVLTGLPPSIFRPRAKFVIIFITINIYPKVVMGRE